MTPRFVPLAHYREYPADDMSRRAAAFSEDLRRRRTVRDFSPRAIPMEVVESALHAAGSAPSGANMQPWHFVFVRDQTIKHQIRIAAEEEERAFYRERASAEWLEAARAARHR